MKLIYNTIRLLALVTIAMVSLLPVELSAQTKVERYDASSMLDNSIVYALPTTRLFAEVVYDEVTETPGELALYAGKHLGIDRPVLQPAHSFRIQSVRLGAYGEPNNDLRYTVQLRSGTTAPFVSLTSDGLLCAVNTDYTYSLALPAPKDSLVERAIDPRQEQRYRTEEYIQATSPARRAEVTAREIFAIRESRQDIVSGNAEVPFPDGKAMDLALQGLEQHEQALMSRFVGTRTVVRRVGVVKALDPLAGYDTDSISRGAPIVAFRFSERDGLLPASDLRGAPYYLYSKVLSSAPELSEKEAKKKERRLKGLIYVVPGKVDVYLESPSGKRVASGAFDVAQIGALEALDPSLFNTKKGTVSLLFYPETGAIRKVSDKE